MKKLCILLMLFLCTIAHGAENDSQYVSKKQFNRLIEVLRGFYRRIDTLEDKIANTPSGSNSSMSEMELKDLRLKVQALEAKLASNALGSSSSAKSPGAASGEVDLDALDSAPEQKSKSARPTSPLFKVYFDLNFYLMPGGPAGGSAMTFDNFHSFVLLDIMPNPDIHFFADVNPNPKFYELDAKAADWLTFRFGKITVPFDDMNPHNIFGGRTNVSRLSPDGNFLPDLFTDLGVGVDAKLINSSAFVLDTYAYVLNGFGSGGVDPLTSTSAYPSFGPELTTGPDNNKDKALGGRVHFLLDGTFGLGASYYTGRWSNQDVQGKRLTMVGVDGQLYLGSFSLRAGQANMEVQLPATATVGDFKRGANYLEAMVKIGENNQWRLWGRAGTQNLDERIVDKNDKRIVGGGLGFKPGLIEWSVEYSKDLKNVTGKTNYQFTNFRVIASF